MTSLALLIFPPIFFSHSRSHAGSAAARCRASGDRRGGAFGSARCGSTGGAVGRRFHLPLQAPTCSAMKRQRLGLALVSLSAACRCITTRFILQGPRCRSDGPSEVGGGIPVLISVSNLRTSSNGRSRVRGPRSPPRGGLVQPIDASDRTESGSIAGRSLHARTGGTYGPRRPRTPAPLVAMKGRKTLQEILDLVMFHRVDVAGSRWI